MANKIDNLTNKGRGRPAGAENKTSSILKRAMLLASEHAGHKVAMKRELERIDKLSQRMRDEGYQPTEKELEVRPELIENSGLITYLVDVAVHSPSSFANLLSKVITVQQQDEERGVAPGGGIREITIEIGYIPPQYEAVEYVG
jgi:hypothetical protein